MLMNDWSYNYENKNYPKTTMIKTFKFVIQ